jgi:flagellar protein FlbD
MILLKKINGAPIVLNSDLIEFIEETPDTVITLANGDKVVVHEGMNEIISKVVDFRNRINGSFLSAAHRRLRAVNVSGRRRRE